MRRSGGIRVRWAAIGAACAVTLGGGTLGVVRAVQTSGERSTYVPVSPARILDTRSDVGALDVLDATPVLLTVTGNVATTAGTLTVVPTGASGVVVNVTAVNPSVDGFVSLRPGDSSGEPQVSTLNVTAGGIFPNGATITLPTTGGSAGQVQIWFEGNGTGGRTDLLIDVVGYYTDHNHDDRYYTKGEVASALDLKTDNVDLVNPRTPVPYRSIIGSGEQPAIAVGFDGNPLVSFASTDASRGLKLAVCADPWCSTWTIRTIDAATNAGIDSSAIAIGRDGNPVIAYYNPDEGGLKLAVCADPTCGALSTRVITASSPGSNRGVNPSIAIDPSGNPVIAYQDFANNDLQLAMCADATCTTSHITTFPTTNLDGVDPSVVINSTGFPAIAHYDGTQTALAMRVCTIADCSTSLSYFLNTPGDVGNQPSLNLDTFGNIIVSHKDGGLDKLRYTRCDSQCVTPVSITLDNASTGGGSSSLVIDRAGRPLIVHVSPTGWIRLTQCFDEGCTGEQTQQLSGMATDVDMALTANGRPVIAMKDVMTGSIRVINPWWVSVGG